MVIDHENAFCAEHAGHRRAQQANRTSAIDGNAGTGTNLSVFHGLERCGKNIRKEQHLLVGQGAGYFKRPGIRFGHAHVLGLAAGDAAI